MAQIRSELRFGERTKVLLGIELVLGMGLEELLVRYSWEGLSEDCLSLVSRHLLLPSRQDGVSLTFNLLS